MNSDQEKTLFTAYGWEYDYIGRVWIASNGCEITIDQVVDVTDEPDGDLALMAVIVENGVRQRP